VNTNSRPAAEVLVNENGALSAGSPRLHPADAAPASEKKKTVAAKPTAAPLSKPARLHGGHRSHHGQRQGGEVVCRYCGSDDLATSFKKRRDARCRACFKQRYGSPPTRDKKEIRRRGAKVRK
jgi:hypothetical protein